MLVVPAFIGGFGPIEIGLVLAVFILLFGASKIPELSRSIGIATGEFEKGREQVEQELAEMQSAKETESETVDGEREVE
jgi:sec-independent protein translocase protein TatA